MIKKRLTIIGIKRKTLNEKILESLQQIFSGFIEIKIFKKEEYFIRNNINQLTSINFKNTIEVMKNYKLNETQKSELSKIDEELKKLGLK